MDLEVLVNQDQIVKDLDGKWNAQREQVDVLMKKAVGSSDGADIEAFQKANADLAATDQLLQDRRSILKRDWERQQAEKEDAKRGMQAANPLNTGDNSRKPKKSLLAAIEEHPSIASLPRATYGDVQMIAWDKPEARKAIQLAFAANEINPVGVLRPGSMYGANEITTSAAASPYQIQDITVPYALYDTSILDLVNTFQMTNKSVTYRRQTALTRNEAATAETGSTTKNTFTIGLQTDTAHMIKGTFVVTEEELMSRADALPFIVSEAMRDLRRTVANEMLQGNNTGEHLYGIYNQAGQTFTQGTSSPTTDNNGGAITMIDALGYGIKECRVTGACKPHLGILHPTQYMSIRLLKNAIGDYLYGNPATTPISDLYIHGVRFIEEIEAIDGTALVGDFNGYYSLGIFQGITVEVGFDSTDFGKWQRTIRFSFYGVNQVRRTSAFEKIANLA